VADRLTRVYRHNGTKDDRNRPAASFLGDDAQTLVRRRHGESYAPVAAAGGTPSPSVVEPAIAGDQPYYPPAPEAAAAPPARESLPLIPLMTGPSEPDGIVTCSGTFNAAYEGWRACDATMSMWLSNTYQPHVWLAYEFGNDRAKVVTGYAIQFTAGGIKSRAPQDWLLQGWDGAGWVTVDEVVGETEWDNRVRRFAVGRPGAYSQYRLLITKDDGQTAEGGITCLSIGQWQLYGYEA
jgi:hypothetical protein